MSTRKEKKQPKSGQTLTGGPRKTYLTLAALFAVLAVSAFVLLRKSGDEGKLLATASATNPPVPAAASANPAFQKLNGQWQRPDGGYILEITSVKAGGKIQAAYYNPNPIHVSRAEVAQEGMATTVFIELQDVGYPGSTYTLIYDPANDQLSGVYFQAALQQSFEVVFVRMK